MDLLAICAGPLVVAFVVTLLSTPVVRRVAVAADLYDRPDGGLKPHQKPVPYLGGTAIFLGWVAALVWQARGNQPVAEAAAWAITCGAILMLTGLIDDIRTLPPRARLLVQAATGVVLVYGGIGEDCASALWASVAPNDSTLPNGIVMAASLALCAMVLVGATNATNLIDGLDGLCAGVLGIAACGYLVVLAALGHSSTTISPEWVLMAMAMAGMAGACLAFLCVNFNPASMFMGDSGSLLLGFNVALAIIVVTAHFSWRGLLAGVLVFGFPIFDASLAITRRWLKGRPLFIGDRSHFYDQVRDRGRSVRATVLICYGLAAVFATLAYFVSIAPWPFYWLIAAAPVVIAALACLRLGLLRVDDTAERSRSGAAPAAE